MESPFSQSSGIPVPAAILRTARQTSQNVNSTLVMGSVAGISFAVLTGHRYLFSIQGIYQSALATTGLALGFNAPAINAANWLAQIQFAAIGSDSLYQVCHSVFSGVAAIATGAVAPNTDYGFTVTGMIEPSADGTLQLQFRSEIDTSQVLIKNAVATIIDAG